MECCNLPDHWNVKDEKNNFVYQDLFYFSIFKILSLYALVSTAIGKIHNATHKIN